MKVQCFILFCLLLGLSVLQGRAISVFSLDSVTQLKEVQIKGHKSTVRSVSVQKISTEELQRFNYQQVSDIVKHFSGVSVKDYGGIGGMKTVSVRSLGAAHTAVVYDGVVMSDAQNGQIDLSKLSLDKMGAISLYNACPSGIFEPARQFSAASVLEISLARILPDTQKREIEVGLSAGAFGLWSPYIGYEQKMGPRLKMSLRGKYTEVKGNYPYILQNGEATQRRERENTDVHSGYGELRLQGVLTPQQTLEGCLHYNESERGLPGAVIFYAPSSDQRLHERSLWAQIRHMVDYKHGFAQKSFLKYEYNYSQFLDPQALNSESKEDDRYNRHEIYASTVAFYQIPSWKDWSFSAGLDISYAYLKANLPQFVYPQRTSLWFNLAAKYEQKWVEVEANLLTSAYGEKVKTGKAAPTQSRLSPAVSLGIFPLGKPFWVVRLFYKDVFRMPTFNDLYYDRVGNTDLRPEKVQQIDVGMTYLWEPVTPIRPLALAGIVDLPLVFRVEVAADFYRNWVQDKIVAFPTKNLFVWSMMNVGKVQITGLNVSARASFPWAKQGWLSYCGLSLWGSYTFEHSLDVTHVDDPSYRQQITYTPVHSGSGGLGLQFPYIHVSYVLTWSGARYCLPENTASNRLDSYADHTLSVQGRWRMLKGVWEAGVEWLNVGNASYEIVRYYPMAGSQWRISLKCRY